MHEAIDRYERGGVELREACAGLTREEAIARPGPGDWSIQELVVHLMDMDAVGIDRMKRVVAEDEPTLLNADENAWIANLHPHDQLLEDALTLFEVNRRQWARVLRLLPAEAFKRFGSHNLRGKLTLRELLTIYSDHLDHHLKFLREKRQRLAGSA